MNKKQEYEVGTDEWKKYILNYLLTTSENMLKEGSDMRSYKLQQITSQLKQYFNTNETTH